MGTLPTWQDWLLTASSITYSAAVQRVVMPLPQPQEHPLTSNSPRLAHPVCPPAQRRLVPGSSSRTKPRWFDSPWVPLRPLLPVLSATRTSPLESEKQDCFGYHRRPR